MLFLSERLDAAATAALHVSQNGVLMPGAAQIGGTGHVLTFQPAGSWAPDALIQVFLDETAHDVHGNRVYPYQGSFRTAADPLTTVPTVVAIAPPYGISDVPRNVVVTLGFNVPLDPASVDGTRVMLVGPIGVEPATLSLDATGQVIRITPAAPLAANAFYYVQTVPGIRSRSGITQPNYGFWYFSTSATSDGVAPAVRSSTRWRSPTRIGTYI